MWDAVEVTILKQSTEISKLLYNHIIQLLTSQEVYETILKSNKTVEILE